MHQMSTDDLLGKDIFSKDGWRLGTIDALDLDVDAWRVLSLTVKLRRTVLEDLQLKVPLIRSQKIQIAVEEIAGAADSVVLERPLEDVVFTGGKPTSDAASRKDDPDDDPDDDPAD